MVPCHCEKANDIRPTGGGSLDITKGFEIAENLGIDFIQFHFGLLDGAGQRFVDLSLGVEHGKKIPRENRAGRD